MAKKFPEDFEKDINANKHAVLTQIGLLVQGDAKRLCPVDTGRLRKSIDYTIEGDMVYIGSDVEYAADIEYGTGRIRVGTPENPIKSAPGHVGYRPFLRAAVFQNRHRIDKLIQQGILAERPPSPSAFESAVGEGVSAIKAIKKFNRKLKPKRGARLGNRVRAGIAKIIKGELSK
jgi:hypothetical protein